MSEIFPIPTPARLPEKITPCPVVEAVLEIRFVTSESWRTLPGLLYSHIRDRYREQRDLPLAQFPEDFVRRDPSLTYLPLVQFFSADFLIQFGPRMIAVSTKPKEYPGWTAIRAEMAWLLERVKESGFVSEGERLSVRYIDFFEEDVFSKLLLGAHVGERALEPRELSISTVLRRDPLTARLMVSNSAILGGSEQARSGSILDLDVWLGSLDFDLFENGIEKFGEAHQMVKQVFFGLLRPEFLATLNPIYA